MSVMSDLISEVAKKLLEVIKEKEEIDGVLNQVHDRVVELLAKQNKSKWELFYKYHRLPCIVYDSYLEQVYYFMYFTDGRIFSQHTNAIYNTPSAASTALRRMASDNPSLSGVNGWDCLYLDGENGLTLNEYLKQIEDGVGVGE